MLESQESQNVLFPCNPKLKTFEFELQSAMLFQYLSAEKDWQALYVIPAMRMAEYIARASFTSWFFFICYYNDTHQFHVSYFGKIF